MTILFFAGGIVSSGSMASILSTYLLLISQPSFCILSSIFLPIRFCLLLTGLISIPISGTLSPVFRRTHSDPDRLPDAGSTLPRFQNEPASRSRLGYPALPGSHARFHRETVPARRPG